MSNLNHLKTKRYDDSKVASINSIVSNLSPEYWPVAIISENSENYKMIQPIHFHKSFIIFMSIIELQLNDEGYQKLQEIEEVFAKFHLWLCNNQYIGENYTPQHELDKNGKTMFNVIETISEIIFVNMSRSFYTANYNTSSKAEQKTILEYLNMVLETLNRLYTSLPRDTEQDIWEFNNFLFKILDNEKQ